MELTLKNTAFSNIAFTKHPSLDTMLPFFTSTSDKKSASTSITMNPSNDAPIANAQAFNSPNSNEKTTPIQSSIAASQLQGLDPEALPPSEATAPHQTQRSTEDIWLPLPPSEATAPHETQRSTEDIWLPLPDAQTSSVNSLTRRNCDDIIEFFCDCHGMQTSPCLNIEEELRLMCSDNNSKANEKSRPLTRSTCADIPLFYCKCHGTKTTMCSTFEEEIRLTCGGNTSKSDEKSIPTNSSNDVPLVSSQRYSSIDSSIGYTHLNKTIDSTAKPAEDFEDFIAKMSFQEQSRYSYNISTRFLSNQILEVPKKATVKTLVNRDYSDIVLSECPYDLDINYIVKRKNILELITSILEVNKLEYTFCNDHVGKIPKEVVFVVTFDNEFLLHINLWKHENSENCVLEFCKKMEPQDISILHGICDDIVKIIKRKQNTDKVLNDAIDNSYVLHSSYIPFLDPTRDRCIYYCDPEFTKESMLATDREADVCPPENFGPIGVFDPSEGGEASRLARLEYKPFTIQSAIKFISTSIPCPFETDEHENQQETVEL